MKLKDYADKIKLREAWKRPEIFSSEQEAENISIRVLNFLIEETGRPVEIPCNPAESRKVLPPGRIGLFEEVMDSLHAKTDGLIGDRFASISQGKWLWIGRFPELSERIVGLHLLLLSYSSGKGRSKERSLIP